MRKGKKHSLSGTPDATFLSTQALTCSASNTSPPAFLAPFLSLLRTEHVPRVEMGNLRRRLHRQSRASPSRVSGREEEEEQDGSQGWRTGRRAEEAEGAEEKGEEGGGRRRLLRSGMAERED